MCRIQKLALIIHAHVAAAAAAAAASAAAAAAPADSSRSALNVQYFNFICTISSGVVASAPAAAWPP
jgi:hypothetical protein